MIFLICFLLFHSQTKESEESYDCPGNNTFIDSDGLCACLPGFPFGDPYSETGCFNCNKTCHLYGECIETNICACKPGYVGNGESHCEPRFPLPISLTPSNCSINGGTKILIELENETSNIENIFCKFGTTMVLGYMVTNKTLICIAPVGETGKIEVKVSDDSNDWNLPGIYFQYLQNDQIYIDYLITAVACFVIILIVVLTIYILNQDSNLPVVSDEDMPLIKNKNSDLSIHGFSPI